MKLVTFNIRYDNGDKEDGKNSFCFRKQLILDKIRKEQPDIICFQEVLPHVAVWLKENLAEYYVIGCGRSKTLADEQTSIAYKKVKFNLIGLEIFWLSETPQAPGSRYKSQSICPRLCTQALFQNMDTGECFRLFNTHLDHRGRKARELGLGQILNKMEQTYAADRIPAILAGDFNASPEAPEMKLLKKYPQYIDLTSDIKATFHDFGRLKEPEKIDYIIARDCFLRGCAGIWDDLSEGIYLSDHYPVCVEINTK